tara:strand:+ start:1687 stop:1956 length:270 start_codon:yes stop_codon:yes gene_type:complete
MEERMIKYIKSLTEKERLLFCKKQIADVIKGFNEKEKALISEFNFNGSHIKRTARNRGGRATTLSANATSSAQMYFKSIEYLKLIVKYL